MLPIRDSKPPRGKSAGSEDIRFEIEFFEGVARRDPDFVEALQILGDAYTRAGQWEKGLLVDKQLARLCPQNPSVFYNLACSYSLIGQVEISKIGLSVMVAEGIDSKTLRRSVGHVPGTAFPGDAGNAAIAAHRDSFFRGLGGVSKGDTIIVNTRHGTFHYVVVSREIVKPTDVWVLRPTASPQLTLITCYPFHVIGPAPKRFIVHAALSEEVAQK